MSGYSPISHIPHPEDYAGQCNAANYSPNDYMNAIPQTFAVGAQEQAHQQYLEKQRCANQQKAQVSIGSALGQAIQKKTLQDEAAQVRSLSEQLSGMLSQLEYAMFEPVPSLDSCTANSKDNPSTVEGNVQTAVRTLQTAQYTLERILVKIGGR